VLRYAYAHSISIGAIPIDDTEGDGVEKVLTLTAGKGADRGCLKPGT